ncbi:hypothetical protein HHI36_005070 [Cryptolaemus montrouzieri]|uniref:Dynein axonemal light chain 1 n=1 Tax=Cryptolaemus montrouzieri TaxID=559131 RepID=A0ABD2NTA2_9CUCU
MARATTIKDAIKRWEEAHSGENIAEAEVVEWQLQMPPIERMDNSLSILVKCRKLSISTNCIDKITGLNSLKNLQILSLARNQIKTFHGLEVVANTLEQLWISYNLIEKMKGIEEMKKLRVLYMTNNLVKDWNEFLKLQELPLLEDLTFVGNPLYESFADSKIWFKKYLKFYHIYRNWKENQLSQKNEKSLK